LRKSGERYVAAEWHCLIRQWDFARARYVAACKANPATEGQSGASLAASDIERARRNLVLIKERIDMLISNCSRARAESPGTLQFALIELTAGGLDDMPSDQTSPRYSKR